MLELEEEVAREEQGDKATPAPLVDPHPPGMTISVARLIATKKRQHSPRPPGHRQLSTDSVGGASSADGQEQPQQQQQEEQQQDVPTNEAAVAAATAAALDAIPKLHIPVHRQRQLLWHTQFCVNGDDCRNKRLGFWCPFAHQQEEVRCVSFALWGKCLDEDRPGGCPLQHTGPRTEEEEIARIRAQIASQRVTVMSPDDDAYNDDNDDESAGESDATNSKHQHGSNAGYESGYDSEASHRSGRSARSGGGGGGGGGGHHGKGGFLQVKRGGAGGGVPKNLLRASQVSAYDDVGDTYAAGRSRRRRHLGNKKGQRNPTHDPNDVSDEDEDDDDYDYNSGYSSQVSSDSEPPCWAPSPKQNTNNSSSQPATPGSQPGTPHFTTSTTTAKKNDAAEADRKSQRQGRLNKHEQRRQRKRAQEEAAAASRAAFLLKAERHLYKVEFCPSLHFCRTFREYGWCDDAHTLDELRCPQFALTGKCPRGGECCPLKHTHESRAEAKAAWEQYRRNELGIKATRLRPSQWRKLPPGLTADIAGAMTRTPEWQRKAQLLNTTMCPLGVDCVPHQQGLSCGQCHSVDQLMCPFAALYKGFCPVRELEGCPRQHRAASSVSDSQPEPDIQVNSPASPPRTAPPLAPGSPRPSLGKSRTLPHCTSSAFFDSETGEPLYYVDAPASMSSGMDELVASPHGSGAAAAAASSSSATTSPTTTTSSKQQDPLIVVPSASGAGSSGMMLSASSGIVGSSDGAANNKPSSDPSNSGSAAAGGGDESGSNKDAALMSRVSSAGSSMLSAASNSTGSSLPHAMVDRLWKTRWCPMLTFCSDYQSGQTWCFGAHVESELRCPQYALNSGDVEMAAASAGTEVMPRQLSATALCPRGTDCPLVHSTGTAKEEKHAFMRGERQSGDEIVPPPNVPEALLTKHKQLKAAEKRAIFFRCNLCPLGPGLCEDCDRGTCFFASRIEDRRCEFFAAFGVCPRRGCTLLHRSTKECLERGMSASSASSESPSSSAASPPTDSSSRGPPVPPEKVKLHPPASLWPPTPALTPQTTGKTGKDAGDDGDDEPMDDLHI